MSSALDYVRHSCGVAGEEVADELDRMESELARANDIIRRCKNVIECNDPMNFRLIFGDQSAELPIGCDHDFRAESIRHDYQCVHCGKSIVDA